MRPIRYGDIRQILPSVTDGTTTLAPPCKRHYLITGSGINYSVVLPDARKMPLGVPLLFENASSEFVCIRNSTSAVWDWIPPRWAVEYVLADQSLAAGVWFSKWFKDDDPRHGIESINDFGGYLASNHYYSNGGMIGACSTGTVTAAAVTQSGVIGASQYLVSTLNSYAEHYQWRYAMCCAGGPIRVAARLYFGLLSTAAEEFTAQIGLGDSVVAAEHPNAVGFLYKRSAYGDFYATKTIAAAGGNTVNISAVAPSTNVAAMSALTVIVDSTGTRADFYSGTTLLFSHVVAANIPSTVACFPSLTMKKTAVTADANRTMICDYFHVQKSFTAPR